MTAFTDPFGGSTVQPVDVSYRTVALTADVTLVWPIVSETTTDYVARIMDVTASGAFSITMPPANAQSTGFDVLFTNRGATTYTVKDNAGNVLTTVAAGQTRYLYITTNANAAGTWAVVLFGATASSVDAASLAGLGLSAAGSLLQVALPVSSFSSSTAATSANRASVLVYTGGVGTLTLPLSGGAGIGATYFFELRNQGTGVLTVAPTGGEMIDAASNIALQPNESCLVHSNGGGQWYTVGRGRNQQFAFTQLSKAITGGTVTLTSTEAANVVQTYTGVLTSNASIVLPAVVQVYYVSNQTSGAFTVTFKNPGAGTTVTVPSGQNAVLFSDGTNVRNNSTTVSGLTSLLLAPGTVTTPSIGYNGDSSTGIYQPVSSTVGFTIGGTERARVTAGGFQADSFTPTSATVPALGVYGSADIRFSVGSALRATITAAGLALVGTLTGVTDLTTTGNTTLGDATTDTLNVGAGGIIKDAAGNVGLGVAATAISTYKVLTVTGPNTSTGGLLDLALSDRSQIARLSASVAGAQLENVGTGSLILSTGASVARLTLNSAAALFAVPVTAQLGAVGTPAFTFTGDTNTGLYSPGADQIAVVTNGVARIAVDTAGVTITGILATTSSASITGALTGVTDLTTTGNTLLGDATTDTFSFGAGALIKDATLNIGVNGTPSAFANISPSLQVKGQSNVLAGHIVALSSAADSWLGLFSGTSSADNPALLWDVAGDLRFATTTNAGIAGFTERFRMLKDGRFYGTALHNNAGAVTGTTTQYIASGTYTPTFTNNFNVASFLAATKHLWVRVGNIVTVTGNCSPSFTTTGATSFFVSLPIASNFAAITDCSGVAVSLGGADNTMSVTGDIPTDRAVMTLSNSAGSGAHQYFYSFQYEVL